MKTRSVILGIFCLCIFVAVPAQDEAKEKKCSHSKFEVSTVDGQQTLIMKADVPMEEISEKMGAVYEAVFTYMGMNNIEAAGPPFAVYYSWEPEGNIVFEAGVPVKNKAEGTDEIQFKEYKSMKVLKTLYKGSYEEMEGIYNELMAYMKEKSLESDGTSWEVYLTDPMEVADPSMNQTLIYFPLK